ncbi:unnamed protein product [Anisakis simplex]|uniref:F-box domain-containing protein n=1 Tax=Anisakis simplex TaxID=6269 RepID=A0A0M3JCT3_ANISI|nr:unnamed protein product [Anisakis simplex]
MQFIKTIQLPSYQSSYITSPTVFYPQQRAKRVPQHRNRFVISCIERGESESDESDMLTLCGACWTWRQLPEDYFPRLLNELVCKNSADAYCLSGEYA